MFRKIGCSNITLFAYFLWSMLTVLFMAIFDVIWVGWIWTDAGKLPTNWSIPISSPSNNKSLGLHSNRKFLVVWIYTPTVKIITFLHIAARQTTREGFFPICYREWLPFFIFLLALSEYPNTRKLLQGQQSTKFQGQTMFSPFNHHSSHSTTPLRQSIQAFLSISLMLSWSL